MPEGPKRFRNLKGSLIEGMNGPHDREQHEERCVSEQAVISR
jgi:hypothetical protein